MNSKRFTGRVSLLAVVVFLAGCSALPRSGPDDAAISGGANVTVSRADKKVGIDYVLVDINKDILPYVQTTPPTTFDRGFGGGRGAAPDLPFGTGDVISVAIFEAQAGGLFIPADAGSRPGNYVTLPNQTVDRQGNISVPYAGRIRAAGRTASEVQAEIEDALSNRAIEPQVVVTTVTDRTNRVAVLGDVNSPAKIEINPGGERILDAIAEAGGLATPGTETYVTLERRGKTATVLFDHLVKTPQENIFVAPGDTVYVNRERRTFLAFGASGASGRFDFQESNLTLGEALGKAGGLLDDRADPSQVFVYRLEDRDLVKKMGVDVSKLEGQTIPVIYKANLRDPAAFFATQQFAMHDKDVLYISNAKSVELTKLLNIINDISTTTTGVPTDVSNAKNAIRSSF